MIDLLEYEIGKLKEKLDKEVVLLRTAINTQTPSHFNIVEPYAPPLSLDKAAQILTQDTSTHALAWKLQQLHGLLLHSTQYDISRRFQVPVSDVLIIDNKSRISLLEFDLNPTVVDNGIILYLNIHNGQLSTPSPEEVEYLYKLSQTHNIIFVNKITSEDISFQIISPKKSQRFAITHEQDQQKLTTAPFVVARNLFSNLKFNETSKQFDLKINIQEQLQAKSKSIFSNAYKVSLTDLDQYEIQFAQKHCIEHYRHGVWSDILQKQVQLSHERSLQEDDTSLYTATIHFLVFVFIITMANYSKKIYEYAVATNLRTTNRTAPAQIGSLLFSNSTALKAKELPAFKLTEYNLSKQDLDRFEHLIPQHLICPFMSTLMLDPVSVIVDGTVHIYDKSYIASWYAHNNNDRFISTGEKLSIKEFYPCIATRSSVHETLTKIKQAKEQTPAPAEYRLALRASN